MNEFDEYKKELIKEIINSNADYIKGKNDASTASQRIIDSINKYTNNILIKQQSNTEVSEHSDSKTLNIANISNLLNADNAPTFQEWAEKYFENPTLKLMYKRKDTGAEFSQDYIYKLYCKAYRVSI